jgi:hypothetical protein
MGWLHRVPAYYWHCAWLHEGMLGYVTHESNLLGQVELGRYALLQLKILLGFGAGKHNPQTGSWANSETEVSHWVQAPRAFCSSTHVEENASREGCFLLMSLPSHSGFMYADDWCFFNDFMSVLASTWKKWYNLCNACADNWGKLWKMKIEDGSQFLCRLHYLPKLSLRSLVDGLTSPVELSAVLLSELQQR